MRILLVEDEPLIAMDLESILGGLGHQVVGVAETRDEALRLAGESRPDAALIDFKQYRLEAHDKWWTYVGPPKAGVTEVYGESLAGAPRQTDWFFNLGIWPNTTFYCFPFADLCGTFVMIPLEPEKSLLRFDYYGPDRPMPEVTKACIKWMNQELGPEDIQLNITNQRGLRGIPNSSARKTIAGAAATPTCQRHSAAPRCMVRNK